MPCVSWGKFCAYVYSLTFCKLLSIFKFSQRTASLGNAGKAMQNQSLSKNPHICAERMDYTPIGIRDAIDLRQVFYGLLGNVSGE